MNASFTVEKTLTEINKIISTAFNSPGEVNIEDLTAIYDGIYSYCSAKTESDNFCIKGDIFYNEIKKCLEKRAKNITFSSLDELYGVFNKIEKTGIILNSVFRYIDRYYVKYNKNGRNFNNSYEKSTNSSSASRYENSLKSNKKCDNSLNSSKNSFNSNNKYETGYGETTIDSISVILNKEFLYGFIHRNKNEIMELFMKEMRKCRRKFLEGEEYEFRGCLSYCIRFYVFYLRENSELRNLQEFFDLHHTKLKHDFALFLHTNSLKTDEKLVVKQDEIVDGKKENLFNSKHMNSLINFIHNEIHFCYTVIDKQLCKSIVNIVKNMHDILTKVFSSKLSRRKNVKSLYGILMFLDDSKRKEVQKIIVKHIGKSYEEIENGEKFIERFCAISEYFASNRIRGMENHLKIATKKIYTEKGESLEIHKILVKKMDGCIKYKNRKENRMFADVLHNEILNDNKINIDRINENKVIDEDSTNNDENANDFHVGCKNNELFDINFEHNLYDYPSVFYHYLQLFEICFDENLENEFIHSCQTRLLEGGNWKIEESVAGMIFDRVDKISVLCRSIDSYKRRKAISEEGSLALITDHFWNFRKMQEPMLHESLKGWVECLLLNEQNMKNMRLNLKIRSNLSRVRFRVGKLMVLSDLICYNIMKYIFDGFDEMGKLQEELKMENVDFLHYMELLEEHGLLIIEGNKIKRGEYGEKRYVNIFDPDWSINVVEKSEILDVKLKFYRNQCLIVKKMKKEKIISVEEFKKIFKEVENLDLVLKELIKKEFLIERDGYIEYV